MKKFNLLLFISVFSFSISFGQNHIYNKTFGGANIDDARGMILSDDGNIVFTGIDKSTKDPEGDTYLSKMSPSGHIIWKKYFGMGGMDCGNAVIRTQDGGYLVIGDLKNEALNIDEGFATKTNANGELEWQSYIVSSEKNSFVDVVQGIDGTFYLTGKSVDPITDLENVLIANLSQSGETLLLKTISSNQSSFGNKIINSGDGEFIICGFKQHSKTKNEEMFVMKVNGNGEVQWKNRAATLDHEQAASVIINQEGNIIVAGGHSVERNGGEFLEMRVYEYTPGGRLYNTESLLKESGEGYLYDLIATEDGYVFSGIYKKHESGQGNATVIETDENFGILNVKESNTEFESFAKNLLVTNEGEIYISGVANYGENSSDAMISKWGFDSSMEEEEEMVETNLIKSVVSPNPFYAHTLLSIDTEVEDKMIRIFDINGNLQKELSFYGKELLLKRENKNDLPTGIYIYHITDSFGNVLSTGKMQVIDQA